MRKILAIIGGMGPKASILLHTQLLNDISAHKYVQNDQDFPNIIHFSFSEALTDRKGFLLGHELENPALEAAQEMRYLDYLGKQRDALIIAGIPCHTFHAPPIYDVFTEKIKEASITHVQLLNLIDESVKAIERDLSPGARIGVLSTTGEWKSRIYNTALQKRGYIPIPRDESLQNRIQECIYNKEWGLKTASTDYNKSVEEVIKIIDYFKQQGAEAIIWGCTEFSLISTEIQDTHLRFFDSIKILSDQMIAHILS